MHSFGAVYSITYRDRCQRGTCPVVISSHFLQTYLTASVATCPAADLSTFRLGNSSFRSRRIQLNITAEAALRQRFDLRSSLQDHKARHADRALSVVCDGHPQPATFCRRGPEHITFALRRRAIAKAETDSRRKTCANYVLQFVPPSSRKLKDLRLSPPPKKLR